jgi:hypothetical protein
MSFKVELYDSGEAPCESQHLQAFIAIRTRHVAERHLSVFAGLAGQIMKKAERMKP